MKNPTYYNRKKKVYDLLGNKCVRCNDDRVVTLQIDHIHGDGANDFRKVARGAAYLKQLLDMPVEELRSRYQLLCPTCNWAKRIQNNENRGKSQEIPDAAYYAVGDVPPRQRMPAALTPLLEAALLLVKDREKK